MKTTYYCLDSHYNTVLQLFCYGSSNSTGSSDAGTKRLVATQKQCIAHIDLDTEKQFLTMFLLQHDDSSTSVWCEVEVVMCEVSVRILAAQCSDHWSRNINITERMSGQRLELLFSRCDKELYEYWCKNFNIKILTSLTLNIKYPDYLIHQKMSIKPNDILTTV